MPRLIVCAECGKPLTLRSVRKHVIEEHYTREFTLTVTDTLVVVSPR